MKKILISTFALTFVALAPAAFAQSDTKPLALSATVINNCTIATTPVAFGNYDPISASPNQAGGTVAIKCTKNHATTIALDDGANGTRLLKDSGSQTLAYELYKPPDTTPGTACNYTSPARWGTTGGALFASGAALTNATRTYSVCGQIAAGLDVAAGTFNDTVQATVNF